MLSSSYSSLWTGSKGEEGGSGQVGEVVGGKARSHSDQKYTVCSLVFKDNGNLCLRFCPSFDLFVGCYASNGPRGEKGPLKQADS